MADETRQELIEAGSRLSTPTLLEEAEEAQARAERDAERLGIRFPAAQRELLKIALARVRELQSEQAVAKVDGPVATLSVGAAFQAAKSLVSDCLSAATNAFEDTRPELVDAFRAGKKIGRSVKHLDAKLALLIPLASEHADALAAWGEPDLAARLTQARETLLRSNVGQAITLENLPRWTAELYEAKGQLYRLIKKLNRAGQRVFVNEPEKQRQYSLELEPRRAKKPASAPGDATPV